MNRSSPIVASSRRHSVDDRDDAGRLVRLRWPASRRPRVPQFSWKIAGPTATRSVVCYLLTRDATTLIREFRPLGFAASERRRRDQSAATRGALCTCVKLRRSLLSFALVLCLRFTEPLSSPFVSVFSLPLFTPPCDPTPRDGGCVYSALPTFTLSPLFFLSFSFTFVPATVILLSLVLPSLRFSAQLALSGRFLSLDSFSKDRGWLHSGETLSRYFFQRQQREAYAR